MPPSNGLTIMSVIEIGNWASAWIPILSLTHLPGGFKKLSTHYKSFQVKLVDKNWQHLQYTKIPKRPRGIGVWIRGQHREHHLLIGLTWDRIIFPTKKHRKTRAQ